MRLADGVFDHLCAIIHRVLVHGHIDPGLGLGEVVCPDRGAQRIDVGQSFLQTVDGCDVGRNSLVGDARRFGRNTGCFGRVTGGGGYQHRYH